MAKARTSRQRKQVITKPENVIVVDAGALKPTQYTERLRAIGDMMETIAYRNMKVNRDLSYGGPITEDEVRRIYLLAKVRRVNGRRQPGNLS